MTDRPNIVLTGFMGTGKTSVGRRLAEASGRTFVDLDDVISAKHGSIPSIFEQGGEEYFRALEKEAVAEVAPRRDQVIATGGGTLLDEDNVIALLGSEIFALSATSATIVERVTKDGIGMRPLLAGADDVEAEIERLLEERSDGYSRFTAIDTTGKSLDEVVEEINARGTQFSSAAQPTGAATASVASTKDSRESALFVVIGFLLVVSIILLVVVVSFG